MKTVTPIQKQLTLIRREFQEQRIAFLLVPFCCVFLVAVTFSISTLRAYIKDETPIGLYVGGGGQLPDETAAEAMQRFALAPMNIKEGFWDQFYWGPVILLSILYWSIMVYYYLSTLYMPRKDRSILFWNSMPVSNTQTVVSKLFAGLILTQGVYIFSLLAIHLVMFFILIIYGMFFDVDLWSTYIEPANIISRFLWLVLFSAVNILWCLPVYAWLLFNSAWAKSAPLAWVSGPLVVLIIPELIIYDKSDILRAVFEHTVPAWMFNHSSQPGYYAGLLSQILTPELLVSVTLGVGLIYAAIRFNRSEDL